LIVPIIEDATIVSAALATALIWIATNLEGDNVAPQDATQVSAESSTAQSNSPNDDDKNGKSQKEYNKHKDDLAKAKEKLNNLKKELKNAKGPKKQGPIKEEINKLVRDIKGHEKEINQKWPGR
jgi:predicted  nucleic acid-binding Zn-ribbon protein